MQFRSTQIAALLLLSFLPGAALWAKSSLVVGLAIEVQPADGTARRARTRDRLSATDRLFVHAKSRTRSYVYVVRSQGDESRLLKNASLRPRALWSFPGSAGIAAGSDSFSLSVVVSRQRKPEIAALFSAGPVSEERWEELHTRLMEAGGSDLSEEGQHPTSVAANTRAMPGTAEAMLVEHEGDGIVVRRFFFND